MEPAEVAYSLADCDTGVLLVDDAFAPVIPELRDRVPDLGTVVLCGDGPQPDGALAYEQLLAENPPAQDLRRGGGDLYGVFYTGGTTGDPKGVMLRELLVQLTMTSVASMSMTSQSLSALPAISGQATRPASR